MIRLYGQPLPGLLKVLDMLAEHNIPMAVASGSLMRVIRTIVSRLGVRRYFKHLVSSRRLKRNKPSPDVYLETARRLGLRPEYCVAVEDSGIGVEAAKAAGMKVIVVPNEFTKDDDFSNADLVVRSLEDITWELISSL